MATDTQLLTVQTVALTGSAISWFNVDRHSVCTVQLAPSGITGTWVVTIYRSNDGVTPYPLETPQTLTNGGTVGNGAMSSAFSSSGFKWLGLKPTTSCAAGTASAFVCGKADT